MLRILGKAMRKVIDSNQLQCEGLRAYLSKSKSNFALLTDYAAMEAYQGDTLSSIFRSMEILSKFPSQVIVLKNTLQSCGIEGSAAGMPKRLIDFSQTKGFRTFSKRLLAAKHGDLRFQDQLLELGRTADQQFSRMLADAKSTGAAIDGVMQAYSKEERYEIRSGEPPSPEMLNRVMKEVMKLSTYLFANHPMVKRLPTYEELPYTLIFRIALSSFLAALERGAHGSAIDTRPDKLRNDLVDMNFVAFASYYDGILSHDARLLKIYRKAQFWLTALIHKQR